MSEAIKAVGDRELLELAAKAAGVELHHWSSQLDAFMFSEHGSDPVGKWNPLTDDGDALRLAVKLGLELGRGIADSVYAFRRHDTAGLCEQIGSDAYAATRRAIVRAAAATATASKSGSGVVR